MAEAPIQYKRAKFSTRLPRELRYTAGHLWMWPSEEDLWRIGFTKFASRMLGEPVELEFEVKPGAAVETGQVIGWVEGFKAVTDVFCPFPGTFEGTNPELDEDITRMQSAAFEHAWIFQVRGTPVDSCVDADGYAAHLDTTIDRMLGQST